jgi:hypothetical protein
VTFWQWPDDQKKALVRLARRPDFPVLAAQMEAQMAAVADDGRHAATATTTPVPLVTTMAEEDTPMSEQTSAVRAKVARVSEDVATFAARQGYDLRTADGVRRAYAGLNRAWREIMFAEGGGVSVQDALREAAVALKVNPDAIAGDRVLFRKVWQRAVQMHPELATTPAWNTKG